MRNTNENIKSLDFFDLKFANFIQNLLLLNDTVVRISYVQKGQVSSRIDEDRIYLKFYDEPDERHIWKNRKYKYIKDDSSYPEHQEDSQIITYQYSMRTLKLQLILYGPNSDYYATILNESMYFDGTKQFLYEIGLAFIPEKTVQPSIHFEKINEQWWHRADLQLYFYNSICTSENIGAIDGVDIRFKYNKEESKQ